MLVLIEGCALQIAGLAALVVTVTLLVAPSALVLATVLMVFGYGQGLVMAPLSSAVLSTVKSASAGAGSDMYGTTTQIGSAAEVAAIGAVFFRKRSSRIGAAGAICGMRVVCAVDHHLRRILVMDAARKRLIAR